MPEIIVNRAAVDYITLTTFDFKMYKKMLSVILTDDEVSESEKEQIPRYVGIRAKWSSGSVFCGEGVQDGASHWLISASGGAADKVAVGLSMIELKAVNVTRLDIQITLEKPEWYRARDFADTMTEGEWKGHRRKPHLIESGGDDTVYLGSYHSDRFTRVYVKEKDWLRYEIVYKRDYARIAWERLRQNPTIAPAGFLVGEMAKTPKNPLTPYFGEVLRLANSIEVQKKKPIKTLSKTYLWLVRSVAPAVNRLLNDHDSAAMTRDLLNEWLETGEVK